MVLFIACDTDVLAAVVRHAWSPLCVGGSHGPYSPSRRPYMVSSHASQCAALAGKARTKVVLRPVHRLRTPPAAYS